jgi:predicted amidohydrolase
MGGSCWWSVPAWRPRFISRRWERANAANAAGAPAHFAALVGAPVIHAAHTGDIACGTPWSPLPYRGAYEGNALIADARGRVLAHRPAQAGEGIVVADVTLARLAPAEPVPDRYWLHRRGALPSLAWTYQRAHGRRYYRRGLAARTDRG